MDSTTVLLHSPGAGSKISSCTHQLDSISGTDQNYSKR